MSREDTLIALVAFNETQKELVDTVVRITGILDDLVDVIVVMQNRIRILENK